MAEPLIEEIRAFMEENREFFMAPLDPRQRDAFIAFYREQDQENNLRQFSNVLKGILSSLDSSIDKATSAHGIRTVSPVESLLGAWLKGDFEPALREVRVRRFLMQYKDHPMISLWKEHAVEVAPEIVELPAASAVRETVDEQRQRELQAFNEYLKSLPAMGNVLEDRFARGQVQLLHTTLSKAYRSYVMGQVGAVGFQQEYVVQVAAFQQRYQAFNERRPGVMPAADFASLQSITNQLEQIKTTFITLLEEPSPATTADVDPPPTVEEVECFIKENEQFFRLLMIEPSKLAAFYQAIDQSDVFHAYCAELDENLRHAIDVSVTPSENPETKERTTEQSVVYSWRRGESSRAIEHLSVRQFLIKHQNHPVLSLWQQRESKEQTLEEDANNPFADLPNKSDSLQVFSNKLERIKARWLVNLIDDGAFQTGYIEVLAKPKERLEHCPSVSFFADELLRASPDFHSFITQLEDVKANYILGYTSYEVFNQDYVQVLSEVEKRWGKANGQKHWFIRQYDGSKNQSVPRGIQTMLDKLSNIQAKWVIGCLSDQQYEEQYTKKLDDAETRYREIQAIEKPPELLSHEKAKVHSLLISYIVGEVEQDQFQSNYDAIVNRACVREETIRMKEKVVSALEEHLLRLKTVEKSLCARGHSDIGEAVHDLHTNLSEEKEIFKQDSTSAIDFADKCLSLVSLTIQTEGITEHRGIRGILNTILNAILHIFPTFGIYYYVNRKFEIVAPSKTTTEQELDTIKTLIEEFRRSNEASHDSADHREVSKAMRQEVQSHREGAENQAPNISGENDEDPTRTTMHTTPVNK